MSLRKDLIVVRPKAPPVYIKFWKFLRRLLAREKGFNKYRVIQWYTLAPNGFDVGTVVEYQNKLSGKVYTKSFSQTLDQEAVRVWIRNKR